MTADRRRGIVPRGRAVSLPVIMVAFVAACSSSHAASQAPTEPPSSLSDAGASTPDGAAPIVTATVAGRAYGVSVPRSYDPKTPTPLVLLLHGYAGNAQEVDGYFKLSAYGDQKNFLVALPEGTKDPLGSQFWDATDGCCNLVGPPVDDSGFLAAVIADVKANYNVDPHRVYVAGHSNGGFMAHRLACDHADVIAGIVSLAGAVWKDPAKCQPTQPVAVLEVHGTSDPIVSYAGGALYPGVPGLAAHPGAVETIATWATKNGCAPALDTTPDRLDLDTGIAGAETVVARHACTQGVAELWSIEGGGHQPALPDTWASLMYGFLDAHPRP